MNTLLSYWTIERLFANGMVFLHLLGAVVTGLVIGYERTYHGRAAGMRTYALVCMASTALVVMLGYPAQWYGGSSTSTVSDPTHVIQGIMTGIGFLGAGVIVKEDFNIRGLSTAASIWLTAVVGVLIGVGFYGAATSAALLAVFIMSAKRSLESLLPHQSLSTFAIAYSREKVPTEDDLRAVARKHGYEIVEWSYQLSSAGTRFEYQLVLSGGTKSRLASLANELVHSPDVLEFKLSSSKG